MSNRDKVIVQLTQELMLKTLANLGFKQQDDQVYVYLALNGPKKAKAIATAIKTHRNQVYRILKKLQNKQIVNATTEFPAVFSTIPFDKLLDLLAKANLEEVRRIEQEKDDILKLWNILPAYSLISVFTN